jgi:hypothetical protein
MLNFERCSLSLSRLALGYFTLDVPCGAPATLRIKGRYLSKSRGLIFGFEIARATLLFTIIGVPLHVAGIGNFRIGIRRVAKLDVLIPNPGVVMFSWLHRDYQHYHLSTK